MRCVNAAQSVSVSSRKSMVMKSPCKELRVGGCAAIQARWPKNSEVARCAQARARPPHLAYTLKKVFGIKCCPHPTRRLCPIFLERSPNFFPQSAVSFATRLFCFFAKKSPSCYLRFKIVVLSRAIKLITLWYLNLSVRVKTMAFSTPLTHTLTRCLGEPRAK